MSVIVANPPPDDGGEGGGKLAGPKAKITSVTIEFPDEWTIEQVAAEQKRIYRHIAKINGGGE